MNHDDIIRMAREAFLPYDYETRLPLYIPQLERFAAIVAAAEREAVLDLVDAYGKNNVDLKDAIRARGNQ